MQFNPDGAYLMPVSFGEIPYQSEAQYDDVWSVATLYATDKDALAALLPPPFEPADDPLVTVFYQKSNQVDFLAGGGYNLMGVNLAAVYNGATDHVQGNYALVLWENNTIPILLGRELLGAPKLFADIPDPFRMGDDWRVQAAENGRVLMEMKVSGAQPVAEDALAMMQAQAGESPWLGWRYLPNPNGKGAALSQAILIASTAEIREAWVGTETRVTLGDVTPETNPTMAHIIGALHGLAVQEYRGGFITHGSNTLLISQNRVLS